MLSILLAAVVVILDRLVKNRILASIPLGGSVSFLPGIIGLTYIRNTGAAFSMFSGMRWILVGFTGVCLILIILFMAKTKYGAAVRFPLALVLGGAIGNLIDRVLNGYVVDMFEVEFVNYAVFNIADSFINIGAVLFVILYLVKSGIEENKEKKKRTIRARRMHDVVSASMSPVEEMTAEEIMKDIQARGYDEVGDDSNA